MCDVSGFLEDQQISIAFPRASVIGHRRMLDIMPETSLVNLLAGNVK